MKTKTSNIKDNLQITKAVVLLAGYGTRCLPFTKVLPKAMLPLAGKPAIHYIIDELEKTQITEVVFVLPKHCNGKIVKQYFKPNKAYERFLTKRKQHQNLTQLKSIKSNLKIKYVFTKKANGSGGALMCAKKHLKNLPFVMLNGDDLFLGKASIVQQMIDLYKKQPQSIVALNPVAESEKGSYGIYAGKKINNYIAIDKMVEKPKPKQIDSNLAGVGRYLLTKGIFEILKTVTKHNGEIYITDALESLIKQNKLLGVISKQHRIDAGNITELIKGNVLIALDNKAYANQIQTFLNDITSD